MHPGMHRERTWPGGACRTWLHWAAYWEACWASEVCPVPAGSIHMAKEALVHQWVGRLPVVLQRRRDGQAQRSEHRRGLARVAPRESHPRAREDQLRWAPGCPAVAVVPVGPRHVTRLASWRRKARSCQGSKLHHRPRCSRRPEKGPSTKPKTGSGTGHGSSPVVSHPVCHLLLTLASLLLRSPYWAAQSHCQTRQASRWKPPLPVAAQEMRIRVHHRLELIQN